VTIIESTIYAGFDSLLHVSRDGGVSWSPTAPISSSRELIESVAEYGGRLFAGTTAHGVFASSDSGETWEQINDGLSGLGSLSFTSFVIRQGELIAGTAGAGTFRLNSDLKSWTPFGNLPMNISGTVYAMTSIGDTVIIGAGSNGSVYRLLPDSTEWAEVNFTGGPLLPAMSFTWIGTELFAGTTNGVFRSSDAGAHWEFAGAGLDNALELWICADAGNLYGWLNLLGGAAMYQSTNRGDSWTIVEPLPGLFAYDIQSYGGRLLVARGDGLWYRTDIPSAVEAGPTRLEVFRMDQNYPNPFNASTTIEFELSRTAFVRLTVVDVLGQEVARLLHGTLPQGKYREHFDASNLPSGLFFSRLQSAGASIVKKMVLAR
jgi:photosystem II stability/assembly factor-like uncharacterized protein